MRGVQQTCVLQKNFPTASGTGSTPSWHQVQSFQGVLNPVSQSEQKLADKDTEFKEYILRFSKDAISTRNQTEIKGENRIVIGTRYYDIISAIQYSSRNKGWKLRLLDITGREDD
jgi:transcription antitermination factor NusG